MALPLAMLSSPKQTGTKEHYGQGGRPSRWHWKRVENLMISLILLYVYWVIIYRYQRELWHYTGEAEFSHGIEVARLVNHLHFSMCIEKSINLLVCRLLWHYSGEKSSNGIEVARLMNRSHFSMCIEKKIDRYQWVLEAIHWRSREQLADRGCETDGAILPQWKETNLTGRDESLLMK